MVGTKTSWLNLRKKQGANMQARNRLAKVETMSLSVVKSRVKQEKATMQTQL